MQYKILNEQPWQILSNAMTISPSSTGYDLQVSANGKDYTTMFHVNEGVTRQVTNLSSGSYYRMLGNEGEVVVNWVRDCSGGGSGGGSGSGSTYTAGEYISIERDVISVTGITPDQYLTSADTQNLASQAYVDSALTAATQGLATENYVDAAITAGTQDLASQGYVNSAITAATQGLATEAYVTAATQGFMTEADVTAITSPIQEQLDDVERVTATALTELHDAVLDLSGATSGYATHAEVTAATANLMTSAQTQSAITAATSGFVTADYTGFTSTQDFENFAEDMQDKEEVIASALTQLDAAVQNIPDMSEYYTSAQTQSAITAATQGMATQTWVGQQGYITSAYTGFTSTQDFEDFAGQMEVKEEVVASAITELHETKVDGVGVKTIEKISQADYNDLVSGGTVDSYTFYVITGQTGN